MVNLVEFSDGAHYAEIAGFDEEDITRFTYHARFKAIANIVKQIERDCPAPKDDPNMPVCEEEFEKELGALMRITDTMQHTDAYYQWIDLSNRYLTMRLKENLEYQELMKKWGSASKSTRKKALQGRQGEHRVAAGCTSEMSIEFPYSDIKFFHEEPRKDSDPKRQTFLSGYASAHLLPNFSCATYINDNLKTGFKCGVETNKIAHHEDHHNHQLFLAYLFSQTNFDNLGSYEHDAQLLYYQFTERASIPYRMPAPYLNQFQEKSARYSEDQMGPVYTQLAAA